MNRKLILLSLFLGMTIFIYVYGIKILNPFYLDWIMYLADDIKQHLFGWLFYNKEEFNFPIGNFDSLSYPNNISIIYTDSIPIFALICKIISRICNITRPFQYFGLWGLICFALTSLLGTAISKKFIKSDIIALLLGFLFVLYPPIINRMYVHTALAGQWCILLSMILILYFEELTTKKFNFGLICFLLGGLYMSIHAYFVPICGIIIILFSIYALIKTKKISTLLYPIYYICGGLIAAYILGGFNSHIELFQKLNEYYNANLNSLFNPMFYKCILPQMPLAYDSQQEGFGYLGLGIILLSLISIIFVIINQLTKIQSKIRLIGNTSEKLQNADILTKFSNSKNINYKLYILIFFLLLLISHIIACFPQFTFGNKILFSLNMPQSILKTFSLFGSNGRFMFIAGYSVLVLNIISLSLFKKRILVMIIIFFTIFFQLWDFKNERDYINNFFEREYDYIHKSSIPSKLFDKGNNFICFSYIPNFKLLYSLTYVAYKKNFKLMNFYFARPYDNRDIYNKKLKNPKSGNIYIFNNKYEECNLKCKEKYNIKGYTFCKI